MLEDFRLEIFEAVVKTGSFTKAALLLDISQPAVSQNIAELERITGHALFERSYGKVSLTPEGLVFKSYADKILMWYRATSETFRSEGNFPHEVTIGVDGELAAWYASSFLPTLSSFHQDVVFSVTSVSAHHEVNITTVSPEDTATSGSEDLLLQVMPALVYPAGAAAELNSLARPEDFIAAGVHLAVWNGYEQSLPLELQALVRLKSSSVHAVKAYLASSEKSVAVLPAPVVADALGERSLLSQPVPFFVAPLQVRVAPSPEFCVTSLWHLICDTLQA